MYLNYQQDDWSTFLPLAEFAYNNVSHSSLKQSPFYALYGRHPCFEVLHAPVRGLADGNYIDNIASVQKHLHSNLQLAISRHKKFADRHRIPAPSFEVGDKVWLDARNIRTTRPAKKLSERRLGPFRIESVIGKYAYRLSLPLK